MTRKGDIGRLAALGGMTAAFVLLSGLPAAQADEISDLKAQMQVLQQRMDQLAQVPSPIGAPGTAGKAVYGTRPVPGKSLIGGSFPRSFLIPGTDTSIRVGGFVDETLDYWLQGGQVNGTQTTTIGDNGRALSAPLAVHGQIVPGYGPKGFLVPVQIDRSRGNGIFSQSPRETRLNVETRTPTAYGEARTFIEFDFAGSNAGNQLLSVSNSLTPRLRYAYGTLGGFLAGQANSNAADPDANPETLDFGGDVGGMGVVRIPQIRYTYAGPYGSAWSVSAETPQTDLLTPGGKETSDDNELASHGTPGGLACVANGVSVIGTSSCSLARNIAVSHAPDLTFASYWSQPWGHVDFRGILRDLTVNDGQFVDRSFFGYGGGISGNVKTPWFGFSPKDGFVWNFTIGKGIGRYLNESDDAGLATNYTVVPTCVTGCTNSANNVIVRPIFEVGGQVGYQHWWLPNLRSNISFGISHEAIPSNVIGPVESTFANRQVITTHVNLIWSPVAFIDTGIEYMFGQRTVVAGLRGQEQVLIGKFRVKF